MDGEGEKLMGEEGRRVVGRGAGVKAYGFGVKGEGLKPAESVHASRTRRRSSAFDRHVHGHVKERHSTLEIVL